MAKIYRAPEGHEAPDFSDYMNAEGRYDREKADRLDREYIGRLADLARSTNKGDCVGEVVRFPIADGQAQYMVWSHKPLSLIHLPLGDAWNIPEAHARGLRLADIRDMVNREKAIADLFARKRAEQAV